jgi:Protein of unknown function (DUF3352)
MPRILLTLIALLTTIAVAAGCGSDGASSSGAAELSPAGSIMYGEVTLKPEGDQKQAIDSIVEKFPGEGGAGERIRSLMEDAFAESGSGISFKKDVEPWLGDEAAFFLSGVSSDGEDAHGAGLVATEDEGKAQDTIEKAIDGRKASYKGHDYVLDGEDAAGVVDGWAVFGTEAGFKAAVDTAEDGKSLEEDDTFKNTLEDAPEDRLGFFYVNSPALVDALGKTESGAAFGQFRQFFKDPLLATVDADDNVARFEATVPASLAASFPVVAEGSDLAGELPADSWLAMAQPDLGKTIDQYIDLFAAQLGGRETLEQQFKSSTGLDLQEDVVSWMGDFGLFVRGTTVDDLGGALIIETSDEQASGRLIDAIARLARSSADPTEEVVPLDLAGGGEGVTFRSPDLPQPVHLFQRDGKVVFAYGDSAAEDALSPSEKLGDTAEFGAAEDALGGDYNVSFYLAVEPILALVDSTSAGTDSGWQEAKPYLEPLGALVGGATKDDDKLRSAFGVTFK